MNEERLQLKGQLAECEQTMKELELQAEGQVMLLRMKARPTASLLELDTRAILAAAGELARLKLLADGTQEKIAKLRAALGVLREQ